MRGKHIVLRVMNIPLLTLDITEMERATSPEVVSNAKGIGVTRAPERRPGVYVLDEAKLESQPSVATPVTESPDSGWPPYRPEHCECLWLTDGTQLAVSQLCPVHSAKSHSGSPMRSDDGD